MPLIRCAAPLTTYRLGKFLHEIDNIRSIDRYGNTYPRRIEDIQRITVSEEFAEQLGLPVNAKMIRFQNIRTASEAIEEPVVVTVVYVFEEATEVLSLLKFHPNELIVSLVERATGLECTEVKQTFSATVMPDFVADLFKLPKGGAALKIVRNYLDARSRSFVVSESYHPADRFSFSISVKKKRL